MFDYEVVDSEINNYFDMCRRDGRVDAIIIFRDKGDTLYGWWRTADLTMIQPDFLETLEVVEVRTTFDTVILGADDNNSKRTKRGRNTTRNE